MKIISLIENTKGAEGCFYEHGLSFYIETSRHKLLFDTGASPAFLENAKKLGVDLSAVDTVIISHGHYDHTGGLTAFSQINAKACIYMQKSAVNPFYNLRNQEEKYIGMDERIPALPQIHFLDGSERPDGELFLFSGVTGRKFWPKGNQLLKKKCENGYVQDDFDHEQYLVLKEKGKKVLISGCAHNGIINILDKYREIFGSFPDYVISGFHMMKKEEYTVEDIKIIESTAYELKETKAQFYTGHCTGEYPCQLLKNIMKDQLTVIHSGETILTY